MLVFLVFLTIGSSYNISADPGNSNAILSTCRVLLEAEEVFLLIYSHFRGVCSNDLLEIDEIMELSLFSLTS